ncbi:LOW QUALITY PROTEIN: hypothetical protein OSB04_019258 [Centaurea solstitialis]|uniref:Uncharacterized protein n=1 Tax=Centaurea solstitialis TaxID=347529 RepID=A0AA38T281_9ASTR|nr:LOW QUALITY PROTEIN: hypothetical protein OSB04_019258 [Centaurea solstitialis]
MEGGDAMLVTYFLQNEQSGSGAEHEDLHYSIKGHVRRFGREEFMLITGLTFGSLPTQNNAHGNTLVARLFPQSVPPRGARVDAYRVMNVWDNTFTDLNDDDKVRIELIIMVEMVSSTSSNLDAFNAYPWGSFIWSHTYKQMKGAFSRRNQVTNKMLLSGFLLAFIRDRYPHEQLVADAYEQAQVWYIESMEWFRNHVSMQPPKVVRRAFAGGDPSDDDDGDHGDHGDDGGRAHPGGAWGGGWGDNDERADVQSQGRRMYDEAGPSQGFDDPMDWDLDIYKDKWLRFQNLETKVTGIDTEQGRQKLEQLDQRKEIEWLSREVAQMQVSGRHSYSAAGRRNHPYVPFSSLVSYCNLNHKRMQDAHFMFPKGHAMCHLGRPSYQVLIGLVTPRQMLMNNSSGVQPYGHHETQHVGSPFGEVDQVIQHVEPQIHHVEPEVHHVESEVHLQPDARRAASKPDKGKKKKTPRPVREKRPGPQVIPPFTPFKGTGMLDASTAHPAAFTAHLAASTAMHAGASTAQNPSHPLALA